MSKETKIPTAPILAMLDQATFEAGWVDGWRGEPSRYQELRSAEAAMTYQMGLDTAKATRMARESRERKC